ncbi:alpha/beta fold hydrolase [Anaeromyxobacter soli]|uniref:alpha/beta fold hydrolase n=1 Tax=Anaeromyxobacter soli TaxID=2922725 RepID=UPI001FAF57F1|nr:alpha/beta fold hydrolase [Anaeromyxobacter sp. SG29]
MKGTADTLDGEARTRRVRQGARLVAAWLVGLALLSAPVVWRAMGGAVEVHAFVIPSPSRVPVLEVTRGVPDRARPVALLVHGFHCNKSMMVPLARRLAASGVDAYAIDLPGHGASREPYSDARAVAAAREALDAIAAMRGVARARVGLVGHSYGASVLARVAGQDPGRPTLVMIGPGYEGGLSPATGNLLVVTAEHDYGFIAGFAEDMLRDASAGTLERAGERSGELARRDARAWQVVPGADHLSLLVSPAVMRDTLAWLEPALRPTADPAAAVVTPRLAGALALLALAGAVLLSVLVARAGACASAAEPSSPPVASRAWLVAIGVLAIGIGLLTAHAVTPLALVRLGEGERVASLLAVAGVAANALALARWRRAPGPGAQQLVRALPPALLAAALVYVAALAGVDRELYHVSLLDSAPERRAAVVVLAAALFPFFAFVQGVVGHAGADEVGVRPRARTAAAVAVLYGAAAAVLPLAGPRLGRFTLFVVAIGAFCAVVSALLDRAARNPAVGAIFSATVTAWVLAVGFLRY